MEGQPERKKDYRCPRCGKAFTACVEWKPSMRTGGRSFAEVIIPKHKIGSGIEFPVCPASGRRHVLAAAAGEVEAVG